MGPLKGIKIIELAGIGPGPFCAMMLADMGAEVIRVDRPFPQAARTEMKYQILNRGRRSISLDLKKTEAKNALLKLIEGADALMEGYRPGVMERLGLGPDVCLEVNPKLVYGRMTGWGQDGPLANAAGHDINYIAITGALMAIRRPGGKPMPPLNLVGDFGGGGMLLAFGIVSALLETVRSGQGQVVDAAMVDGASSLMAMFYGMSAGGAWSDTPGENFLDGGAPYYDTYETADKKYVAIGSIEPQFYALLLKLSGVEDPMFMNQNNKKDWPEMKEKITEIFKARTRDEWCEVMEGSDVCFAPVLSMSEAMDYEHNKVRGTFVELDGVRQPAPAPRFSRTTAEIQSGPANPGEHTMSILSDWGFTEEEIESLKDSGAI